MATRKPSQKRPPALKEKVRPEHLLHIPSSSDSNTSLSVAKKPSEPTPSSRRRSWTLSLDGLIRLDWLHRTNYYHRGSAAPAPTLIEYNGHTYSIESLEHENKTDKSDVFLFPEIHYYVVPIHEDTPSSQIPQRLLLVRSQNRPEDSTPHLWVVKPPDADPTQQIFAYLHIIGGENDTVSSASDFQPVGIAEAILTATESAPSKSQAETKHPPTQPSATQMTEQPLSHSPQPSLTDDDRSRLRQILVQRFNLEELKDLAFDLCLSYDLIPHETVSQFSRELLMYCERRGQLSCLIIKASSERKDEFLEQLVAKLPPCNPYAKVQVVLRSFVSNLDKIRIDIAAMLDIDANEVEIQAAASGSLRLLVGLPQKAATRFSQSEINNLEIDGNPAISITRFDSLDNASQNTWRNIADNWAREPIPWNSALRAKSSKPDPELLACIDYFHEARAIYTNCGPALTRVQDKFYAYLRDKFDYSAVPIDVGTTRFSEAAGHLLTERPISTRLVGVPPGVVTRVLKDGYKRGQTIKRWTEVVTNQLPTTLLRRIKRVRAGRLYVEIETPTPLAIEQLIDEATGHFRLIDGIYAVLALVDSQSGDLNSLAAVLQRYTDSSLPLVQVSDRLYEHLQQIRISRASMRLRYALRDAPRDRQFEFIVIGNAKLLDETREIIIRQAARQDGQSRFVLPDVEWLKTRLTRLRQQLDDQTLEALARGIATFLGNLAFAAGLLDDQVISTIELAPTDPTRGQQLTPDFMASAVSPYLLAIANIQAALDRIRRKESGTVIITALQANPIRVNFRGGVDAVRVIREDVSPWRRDNVWQTDGIKMRRTRMKDLEKEAKTSVTAQARMNLLRDEIAGREESLKKDESDLALVILQKNGLDLSKLTKTDKRKWIQSMLPSLATVIDSELQIAIG